MKALLCKMWSMTRVVVKQLRKAPNLFAYLLLICYFQQQFWIWGSFAPTQKELKSKTKRHPNGNCRSFNIEATAQTVFMIVMRCLQKL